MDWDALTVARCPACKAARDEEDLVPLTCTLSVVTAVVALGVALGCVLLRLPSWLVCTLMVVASVTGQRAWRELRGAPRYVHFVPYVSNDLATLTPPMLRVHTHLSCTERSAAAAMVIDYELGVVQERPLVPHGVLFRVQDRLVNGKVHVVTEQGDQYMSVHDALLRAAALH